MPFSLQLATPVPWARLHRPRLVEAGKEAEVRARVPVRIAGVPRRLALPRPAAGLPREVAVLAAIAFSVAVGFGLVAPALPVFAREFGVGRTAAGAVISAFAVMRLVFALAGGRLVDRFGERVVLTAGLLIVGVSTCLAGLSQSYGQLLVLRGAGGVGSAMFTVAATSLLLRVAGPEQRGRASGLYQGGFVLGGIAGPGVGGLLSSGSLRAPFFVYGVTLAVAAAIAAAALRGARLHEAEAAGTAAPDGTGLWTALRSPAYLAVLVVNFGVGFVLFGSRTSLVPLFVVESLRRDPVWTGIGLAVSSAVTAALLVFSGRFSDRRGRRPALVLGSALSTVGVLLLAVPTGLGGYLVGMVLLGVGASFVSPASAAVVGDIVSGRSGTVVAAFGIASDVGVVVGPLFAGLLADRFSYGVAFGSCVVVLGAGLLAAAGMPETRPSPVAR